ncbi:MAG TPA: pyridoxal-dependent decarboxylase, partial [Planctomycetota bacterium]|nr:pyridoxal-dependent decarboxylase [Planctomycetota bacterium]
SVDKAVDCVGLGREARRPLPTDDEMRVRLDALEDAIANDKKDGVKPLCIVAMAGTTNTGAVDDLVALRRIADREGMWIHADAAYGGGMLLSGRHAGILRGLELADSVTIDPHKWFFAPLDAGALLVKDAARLTASFGFKPPYLTDEKDVDDQRYQYFVHGFEQSRRFRSLKVWMSFKRYGAKQIGAWIDANVDAVDHLDRLVRASDDFESLVRPKMSAICIRYRAPRLGEPARARLHAEASRRIEQGGRFWFSTTRIKDKAWFRICPVNFRTRREHMDELLATLRKECAEIERAGDRR